MERVKTNQNAGQTEVIGTRNELISKHDNFIWNPITLLRFSSD